MAIPFSSFSIQVAGDNFLDIGQYGSVKLHCRWAGALWIRKRWINRARTLLGPWPHVLAEWWRLCVLHSRRNQKHLHSGPKFWCIRCVTEMMSVFLQECQKYFPSTLSSEIARNWWTDFEFLSFGVNIASVSFQASWTSPFLQTTFRVRLRSSGHVLQTLYGMAFCPGSESNRAFLILVTYFTSPIIGSATTNFFSAGFAVSIWSQSPSASFWLASECVSCRLCYHYRLFFVEKNSY